MDEKDPNTAAPPDTVPASQHNEVVTRLRDLEAKQAKRDEAERKAAEQRATEQGQWEQLARDREQQIAQLTTQAERAERYSKTLHTRIDSEIKDWPSEVKDLVPAADGDPDARQGQVEKLRPLIAKLQGERLRGTPAGPRGAGNTTPVATADDLVREKRAQWGGL